MSKQTERFLSNMGGLAALLGLALLPMLFPSPAYAETPTGWVEQRADLVSSQAAAELLDQRGQLRIQQQSALPQPLAIERLQPESTVTPTVAAEFAQLAEALENDPRRMYQFVRNHFKYEPYYGALKGPYLTLLERSGNDFDQAALLVELLRAAGYSADYQYGSMDIPVSAVDNIDMAHWLGAEADATIVGTIIASGGIPATNYGTYLSVDRVWVVADIGGTIYALDPAFKPSTQSTGIDLAAAMGYSQTDLLNAAGGIAGTNSIEGLDSTALNGILDNFTTQLLAQLKQDYPNAHLYDIIGGLTIVPDESSALPSALPFVGTPAQTAWSEIPPAYVHTVRLQHGAIDETLDIPSIAGKKLSIAYTGDTTPIDPPPANVNADFGTVAPGEEGTTSFTVQPGNPNTVAIQVTATLAGTDPGAFFFVAGGGTQTIPAGGQVDVQVKFTGVGQAPGRKNASLNLNFTYQGNPIGSQTYTLTGAVESTPVAQIYLNDQLLFDEGTPSGDLETLSLSIDHPYANNGGIFADQNDVKFPLKRTGIYVLASGFGGDRHSTLLNERQRRLDQMLLQGMAGDSPEVRSETLNIVGQNWFKQTQLNAELLGAVSQYRILRHHRFGIIGQEDGYFVDIKAQFSPTLPLTASAVSGAFQAAGFIASAMEHGVLEQLQGADKPALSTVKIFNLHNQGNGKFFLANSGNFASVWSQLTGYTSTSSDGSDDLSQFQQAVAQGATLILPQNGQVTLNSWSGKGYVDYRVNGNQRSLGMIIGGGLNGGYVTVNEMIDAAILQTNTLPTYTPPANIPTPSGVDPVDLGSGAYLNNSSDIILGGSGPRGLSFGRSYNSQQLSRHSASMAPGWTHSYDIYLSEHSDIDSALGKRTPQDAAALLVSAFITRDLMAPTQPDLKAWVVTALIAQWASDQLLDKAVSVNLGHQVLTYRQQPDGSFTPPPGVTTDLIENPDGTFKLQERFGTALAFNADNRILNLTDIDGNHLNFTYAGNKLTQVTDTYNRTLTLTYTGDQLTQVSDDQSRSVNYTYDAVTGDLTEYRDAENKLWQYGYDGQHQILTVTDPVNVTIVDNVYDGNGRVIQQSAPRDNNTTAIYKLHYTGLSSSEEDPLGHRTTYYYDFTGRTVAVENALGEKNAVEYDGQGQVVKQTDALGHALSFSYDGHNNLVQSTNALNQSSALTYDAQQRLIRVTDALNHSAEIGYDAEHHPVGTSDAENNQTATAYFADGLVQSRTDARNTATQTTYDSHGFPNTTKTAAHPAVTTKYDAIGRLQSLTDQAGAVTQFSYDARGLVIERTDPLGHKNTSVYDDAGRIISHTDRNLDTVSTAYTPSGKLDRITYPDATQVSFDYDSRDHLVTMTDPSGSTGNSYDAAGRLTAHTDPNGFQVQYQYDAAGNLTMLTYPGNKSVSYGYDALNRLASVQVDWLANTPTTAYHYDAAGRLTQIDQANGSQTVYGYDNADRLTGLTHSANGQPLADYQYTLDPNGNRVKAIVEQPQLPEQLINRTLNYQYNAQSNRLNSTGDATFSYDDEGQLQSKNSTAFAFDYAHRLIQHGNNQYVYDGVGNRIRATRNGATTKYIYDAAGNLLAEADNANQITRYYIYGHGLLGFINANTNQLYTYHFDSTGHTVAITDQSQQTANTYAYDPYGRIMGQSESITQPFKYVGQFGVFSEDNNLYYMRARYYDAEIGRFISEDPIGFQGGLNLYAYVGGNPIMLVDPSGLSSTETFNSRQGDNLNDIRFSAGLQAGGQVGARGLFGLEANVNLLRAEGSIATGESGFRSSFDLAISAGKFSIGLGASKYATTAVDFRNANWEVDPFISTGNASLNKDFILNIDAALLFGAHAQINISQGYRNLHHLLQGSR